MIVNEAVAFGAEWYTIEIERVSACDSAIIASDKGIVALVMTANILRIGACGTMACDRIRKVNFNPAHIQAR
jgi:hypothetical protein